MLRWFIFRKQQSTCLLDESAPTKHHMITNNPMHPWLRRGFALLLMLLSIACERQTREFPYDRAYFIGTWDYREVYVQRNNQNTPFTEVNGFVRFSSGLASSLNFKGNFELSFRDEAHDTTYNYAGTFKWRVDGAALVVTMDGFDDEPLYPALGIGRGTQTDFNINGKRFKENFIEIYNNVDQGFSGIFMAAFLERR